MHRDERRSTTTKRVRETEAEAVAFFVCSAVGLETGTAAQDYIGLYGGDAKLLNESLEYVQRTATEILNAIRRMILHPRHPPKKRANTSARDSDSPTFFYLLFSTKLAASFLFHKQEAGSLFALPSL